MKIANSKNSDRHCDEGSNLTSTVFRLSTLDLLLFTSYYVLNTMY